MWNIPLKNYFYTYMQKPLTTRYRKIRFFYPVTAYLVRLTHCNIFFNIFYKTSLEKFQDLNKNQPDIVTKEARHIDHLKLKLLFYR